MINSIMRRIAGAAALVLTGVLVAPVAGTDVAAQAATSCPTVYWGSLAKADHAWHANTITDVRAGEHPCFDRLVIDLTGPAAGYTVRYVTTVRQEASGAAVPLRGAADIAITVTAATYDSRGRPTYRPASPRELVSTSGFASFRQVASAGSFEGQTTIGLGVRARLPMRTFLLDGPGSGSRLVIDVAHQW